MAFSYRFRVWDKAGVYRGDLYVGEPIDQIGSWTQDGDGNCRELSMDAKVIELSFKPLAGEIMQLQSSDNGIDWRNHFKGYVTRPGSSKNNTKLSEIKLVGFKDRLKKKVISDPFIPAGDVAEMVRYVMSQSEYVPAGVNVASSEASDLIPNTGFSLQAPRYPNLETVHHFLNEMALRVSGATWGVNAAGDFFFQVAPASYNVLSEGSGVFVKWGIPDAENVVDKVRLILADKPFPDSGIGSVITSFETGLGGTAYIYGLDYLPYPIEHFYDSGAGYDSEELVLLPWSTAWLTELNRGQGEGTQGVGFTNFANQYDQNPDTYAELTGATGYISSLPSAPLSERIVALNVRYSSTESAEIKVVIHNGSATNGLASSELLFTLPNTNGAIANQDLIAPISVTYFPETTDANSWRFDVKNNDGNIKIYEIITYGLNANALDEVAQAYIKLPAENVGDVTVIGRLLNPGTYVDLALETGEEIRVPTELFESRITKDGQATIFRIGQKFSPDDTALNKLENDRLESTKFDAVKFRR